MHNQVGRDLPQICENRVERAQIPMNIRYDRDFHFVRRPEAPPSLVKLKIGYSLVPANVLNSLSKCYEYGRQQRQQNELDSI